MTRLRHAWASLPKRDRRALAFALGALLVAVLGLRAVPAALRATAALRERTASTQATLRAARQTVAAAPVMRDSLAVRAQRLVGWAPRLFGGTSASDAQADLAAWVTGTAAARNVHVLRQDIGADSTASLFVRLTQRIEAEGDVRGVTGWVAALESSDRLIRVEALRVDAPDATSPTARSERLHVEIVIRAWAAPRKAPSS